MVAHLSGVNWANLDLPEFLIWNILKWDTQRRGATCPRYLLEFRCSNARNIVKKLNITLSFFSPSERE